MKLLPILFSVVICHQNVKYINETNSFEVRSTFALPNEFKHFYSLEDSLKEIKKCTKNVEKLTTQLQKAQNNIACIIKNANKPEKIKECPCGPNGCNSHGKCISVSDTDFECKCRKLWSGDFCNHRACPDNCSGKCYFFIIIRQLPTTNL